MNSNDYKRYNLHQRYNIYLYILWNYRFIIDIKNRDTTFYHLTWPQSKWFYEINQHSHHENAIFYESSLYSSTTLCYYLYSSTLCYYLYSSCIIYIIDALYNHLQCTYIIWADYELNKLIRLASFIYLLMVDLCSVVEWYSAIWMIYRHYDYLFE